MIRFVQVSKENWRECVNLPTSADHAQFVAPNVYSIAEAQFYPTDKACCIYNDDKMVGFTLYGPDDEGGPFWISRLMIAEDQRRKGYGRAALHLILAEAKSLGHSQVGLSTHPENVNAIRLYESVGFRATGALEHGEAIYICPIEVEQDAAGTPLQRGI